MKYLFFLLYVIVVGEFLFSSPIKIKKNSGNPRGRYFYKLSGIINVIFGSSGIIAINILLMNKNIIPQMYVWIGIIGFMLIEIYGMFCIVKMMLSVEP